MPRRLHAPAVLGVGAVLGLVGALGLGRGAALALVAVAVVSGALAVRHAYEIANGAALLG